MSRHFPFVGKLTELGTRFKSEAYRSENPEDDRLLICSGLMKCADISNPVGVSSYRIVMMGKTKSLNNIFRLVLTKLLVNGLLLF